MLTEDKVIELFFMADGFCKFCRQDEDKIYAKYRREMYMPSWCHPLKEKSCLSSFLSIILDTVGLNIPAWVKSASVFVILFTKAMSYQLSLNLNENI